MFDISEEQRTKFYIEERALPSFFNFNDYDPSEKILDRGRLNFCIDGRILEPLKTLLGIAFIDVRYLKPFADLESGYELYERTAKNGSTYIAAKSGFMLLGIFCPYDVVCDNFINTLDTILNLTRIALLNKRQTDNDMENKQIEIDEVVQ
jgi:hypothetical protein